MPGTRLRLFRLTEANLLATPFRLRVEKTRARAHLAGHGERTLMSSDENGITWFLAQFKPNSHHIARRNLLRQGFRVFLPMQEETRRSRSKFVTRMQPLFPGYLFVALDLKKGGWRAVNSTYGITRLVSLGKEPTPVPADLVNQLMTRCNHDGKLLPTGQFKPGDLVTLTKGPFTDFVARVEGIAPDRRVHVLMELMGAQTRMALSAGHLRAT